MQTQKLVIRFDEYSASNKYSLRKLSGTATPASMIRVIDGADLKANPREAKVGDVTDEIQDCLETTPQLFPFKSKGLLLAAASCISRDRSRFELNFRDNDIEGILDGGHNLLAIALFILNKALGLDAPKVLKSVKRWEHLPLVWLANRRRIEEVESTLDFLTPIEIVYPQDGDLGRDEFEDAILDVARARNNNAQLTEETKANKAGFYDALRDSLDTWLVSQIEWKTNDGGRIKVRDLVALSWIPLSRIPDDLPGKSEFVPVSMYRNKGACISAFNDLMASDLVSKKAKGDIRELEHPGVKSALKLLADLPGLFDLVYEMFPDAYNAASPGFGRISSVRVWDPTKAKNKDPKYLSAPPKTKFYQRECKYDFPDGFTMPLMWALSELMEYKNGQVAWKSDPTIFIKKNIKKTLEVYHGMIQMANYDPQKVGKTLASYLLLANDFKNRIGSK